MRFVFVLTQFFDVFNVCLCLRGRGNRPDRVFSGSIRSVRSLGILSQPEETTKTIHGFFDNLRAVFSVLASNFLMRGWSRDKIARWLWSEQGEIVGKGNGWGTTFGYCLSPDPFPRGSLANLQSRLARQGELILWGLSTSFTGHHYPSSSSMEEALVWKDTSIQVPMGAVEETVPF